MPHVALKPLDVIFLLVVMSMAHIEAGTPSPESAPSELEKPVSLTDVIATLVDP